MIRIAAATLSVSSIRDDDDKQWKSARVRAVQSSQPYEWPFTRVQVSSKMVVNDVMCRLYSALIAVYPNMLTWYITYCSLLYPLSAAEYRAMCPQGTGYHYVPGKSLSSNGNKFPLFPPLFTNPSDCLHHLCRVAQHACAVKRYAHTHTPHQARLFTCNYLPTSSCCTNCLPVC